jgi:hypothetical protein
MNRKGNLDMVSVWFWRRFSSRPLHLFGTLGAGMGFIGVLILAANTWLRPIFPDSKFDILNLNIVYNLTSF